MTMLFRRDFIERGGESRNYDFWIADVDISKKKKKY